MFVSGSAEIYEAAFAFDASWDGFARTAVFECGGERREQMLVGDRCVVPWEILHTGAYLRVGVYGVDGNATMPTVYSGTMFVARGAEPSEAAREHSADMFDQIVEIGQQAAEAKEQWENMTAEAETLPAGTPATASYAVGVLSLGIPKGADGITPHIDETTKHWMIGNTDTGIVADGKDAKKSFVITFSASVSGDSITYSCDKTYAEILAAYNDGRPLMALIPVDSSTEKVCTSTYRFVYGIMNMNRVDFYAEIRARDLDVEQATLLCATVWEPGLVHVIKTDMQLGIGTLGIVKGVPGPLTGYQYTSAEPNVDYMPPVPITAADNGKFLRVVNGAWAAATIENANGVSF